MLKELINKGNYKEAFQLLERVEKVEDVVDDLEKKIDSVLSQLESVVSEPSKSKISDAKTSLKSQVRELANLIAGKNGLYANLEYLANTAPNNTKKYQNAKDRVQLIIGKLGGFIESTEADLTKLLEAIGNVENH